ncbi:hypothetical protein LguiB_005292 [Lonicera macranthoides]
MLLSNKKHSPALAEFRKHLQLVISALVKLLIGETWQRMNLYHPGKHVQMQPLKLPLLGTELRHIPFPTANVQLSISFAEQFAALF